MENAKPVAKSLHTITVLIQVARVHESNGVGANLLDGKAARAKQMAAAMDTLGLSGRPDPYGLAEKALRMMGKA